MAITHSTDPAGWPATVSGIAKDCFRGEISAARALTVERHRQTAAVMPNAW